LARRVNEIARRDHLLDGRVVALADARSFSPDAAKVFCDAIRISVDASTFVLLASI
jgi:hypothetical protein